MRLCVEAYPDPQARVTGRSSRGSLVYSDFHGPDDAIFSRVLRALAARPGAWAEHHLAVTVCACRQAAERPTGPVGVAISRRSAGHALLAPGEARGQPEAASDAVVRLQSHSSGAEGIRWSLQGTTPAGAAKPSKRTERFLRSSRRRVVIESDSDATRVGRGPQPAVARSRAVMSAHSSHTVSGTTPSRISSPNTLQPTQ